MPTPADAAPGRRRAIVVATQSYADAALTQLRAPGRDASELATVLADAAVGGFEVETALDEPADSLRRRIARFCAQGTPHDLALVYLSCHGVLDDRGRLYYATVDTDRELLSATAVPAAWLNEQLEDCRCRRQILVLDCCHSGAFARGAKGAGGLALRERFEGRGRVVLTGSRATEYSFEHGHVVGDGVSSVFTSALVRGLRSGDADRDRDGFVSVSELYDYAYEKVRSTDARQTPTLWTYGAEGDLMVAHNPCGAVVEPAPLPEDLIGLLESARPRVREGAVAELAELLTGSHAGRALTARARLERVAAEDVPGVAAAARAALDAAPAPAPPPGPTRPAEPPLAQPPPPGRTDRPARGGAPRRRRMLVTAAATTGLGALVLAIALWPHGGAPALPPIPVPGTPQGIAVGDGTTWITLRHPGRVGTVDEDGLGPQPVRLSAPDKLAVGDGAVWVSYAGGRWLARIDPEHHTTPPKRVPVYDRCGCTIVRLEIGENALWAASDEGTITKRNLTTGREIEHYDRPPGFEGVFAVGGGAAWAVGNDDGGYVTQIGSDAGQLRPRHPGHDSSFYGVAYGSGRVWVADTGQDLARGFHPPSRDTADVGVGYGVYGNDAIAVAAGRVLLWNPEEGILTQIDADDPQHVKPPPRLSGYTTGPDNRETSELAADEHAAWVTDPAGRAVFKIGY
jgi:hypothetical protein